MQRHVLSSQARCGTTLFKSYARLNGTSMTAKGKTQIQTIHGAGSPDLQQSGLKLDPLFEPLLDVNQAARLLRMHPKTLLKRARSGEIPATRVGRNWRFRASILNDWFEKLAS